MYYNIKFWKKKKKYYINIKIITNLLNIMKFIKFSFIFLIYILKF